MKDDDNIEAYIEASSATTQREAKRSRLDNSYVQLNSQLNAEQTSQVAIDLSKVRAYAMVLLI